MLARRCVEPFVLGGYEVPEGTLVMTPPWLLHRDGSRWPRAPEFEPGRWLDGGGPPHRFSYLPFGAGTRKCIGSGFALAEGTIALAAIARTHRLERLPGPHAGAGAADHAAPARRAADARGGAPQLVAAGPPRDERSAEEPEGFVVEGPELMELLGLDEDGVALADDVDGLAQEDLPPPV